MDTITLPNYQGYIFKNTFDIEEKVVRNAALFSPKSYFNTLVEAEVYFDTIGAVFEKKASFYRLHFTKDNVNYEIF